ncbi:MULTISPECIES: CoA pyrophosphatase [Exiguobacterium]|uniref:NUDIX hydrolase n=1 Tax=Exiguobacterium TaxID=33986 RepID=UPI000479965B|nr:MULTISPECIES: CoA pyrophosphatase [Exiguobacterium]MCK2157023.1 CoA pyrophosphatase [Exiguobacterium sp. 17-1]
MKNFRLNDVKRVFASSTEQLPKNAAAVLIPLVERNGEIHLLFQVRAKTLRSQPGEIAFPGGRIDPGEQPREAAIRETTEELNVNPTDIEIIGTLEPLVTPNRSIIYPYLGILTAEDIHPSPMEVDHIFYVALADLLAAEPIQGEMEWRIRPGKTVPTDRLANRDAYVDRTYKTVEHFYEHEEYLIWGLTAKILRQMLRTLTQY